ncbi:helix-turn-helix transcriptional regulator [Pseudomonas prosekii]|uniref:helix-turn-helix transcriptional regulator n=1 Tax=Pseudomonas prosekii TaxID=1148509 RepID=UPI00387B0907
MNTQILFPHIGRVIASTGTRGFAQMLHELMLTRLAIDATHISQTNVDAHGHLQTQTCGCWLGAQLTSLPTTESSPQLHMSRRDGNVRYLVSVHRSPHAADFSAQDRRLFEGFAPLLLPMVEKHVAALHHAAIGLEHATASSEGQRLDVLRQRFSERLVQSGLRLSNRELEVCIGLLAGSTAPELAQQFNLKANTVESYLKRAAIKMGISGRHSLKRWMYSAQDRAATETSFTLA